MQFCAGLPRIRRTDSRAASKWRRADPAASLGGSSGSRWCPERDLPREASRAACRARRARHRCRWARARGWASSVRAMSGHIASHVTLFEHTATQVGGTGELIERIVDGDCSAGSRRRGRADSSAATALAQPLPPALQNRPGTAEGGAGNRRSPRRASLVPASRSYCGRAGPWAGPGRASRRKPRSRRSARIARPASEAADQATAIRPEVELVEINIAYGTEKQQWLEAATAEFRNTNAGRRSP